MAAQRALIVDADWRMRKLVRTNLEAQGLEVAEVAGRGVCLDALRRQPYDLVLVSADLPDGNGWNLVSELRHTPEALGVPIVVIVAEPARRRLLGHFQRVSVLVKPFSVGELLSCLECALQLGQ